MDRQRFVYLGICLLCLMLVSCASHHPQASLTIEIGDDPTPKNAEELGRQIVAGMVSVKPQDMFALRCVDNKTDLITTTRPEDDEATTAVVEAIQKRIVQSTNLAIYFETMAEAAEHTTRPMVILLYSDGLDDGAPNITKSRIEAAARRLAANPQVKAVVLIGPVRDIRPGWTGLPEMLACLNDGPYKRLLVQPASNMNPDAITQLLDDLRSKSRREEPTHEKTSQRTP